MYVIVLGSKTLLRVAISLNSNEVILETVVGTIISVASKQPGSYFDTQIAALVDRVPNP